MADGRGAVGGIDDGVVNAGDGDGPWGVPVAVGEDQCSTDGGRRVVATAGRDGDVAGRLGVEDDGVGRRTAVFSGIAAGRQQGDTSGVVVGGGKGVVVHSDAAVVAAAGGMADGRGAVAVDVVVNAGDGDALCRVPVGHGEGQCATDGGCRVVVTAGGDGDVAAGFGVEDDGVGLRAAVFTGIAAGGRQGDTGSVVVVGGHAHSAGDAAVAAAYGSVHDVEALVYTVVIVNAGDGDGLCRAKVAVGEAQRGRTDGGRIGVVAGRGDGDRGARLGIEDDGVGLAAGFSHADRVGGEGQAGGVIVGGGHAHVAGDAVVAAAAGGMGDVEGL